MLANVALPAFLPHSLATLAGIFILAVIEGWFLSRCLKLGFGQSYRHGLAANFRSTVAGIPLAWLLWVLGLLPVFGIAQAAGIRMHPAVESFLLYSTVLGGYQPNEWTETAMAAGWIISLIPFWLGSVWIERRTIQRRLPDVSPALISKAVIRGNLATYSLFLAAGAVMLFHAVADLPQDRRKYAERRQRKNLPEMRALELNTVNDGVEALPAPE